MKKKSTTIMPFDNDTSVSETTSADISENYSKAIDLNYRIKLSAQMAQQNLIEACKGLKEMKDTGLYSELGYGSFEEYTETEIGIKSRQAYRYISIIENLPEDFVSPGANIGASKLYLLSTLSEEERAEVAESVDLESATKRELEKKVKEIKTLRHDLEKASEENKSNVKECEQLKMELNTTSKENAELQKRIDELESRPVEVAVESNEKKIEEIRTKAEQEKKDIKAQYNAKIEELTENYEKKLSEAEKAAVTETVPDSKETFKMYYTAAYNAFESLVKFVKSISIDDENKTVFIEKVIKLTESLKESVKDV